MRVLERLPARDVALGAVLTLVAVASTAREADVAHPVTEVVAALTVGFCALRTRAPLAMTVLTAASLCAYGALPGTGTPLWTFLGCLVVCFSAGANLHGGRRLCGLGALLAASYVLQILTTARLPADQFSWADVYVAPLVITGGPAFAGWLLQRSRRQTAELRRLTLELEAERDRHARDAALAERNRIARELHDVISHSVSVMVVQAGAAERLLAADAPARAAVHAIRETGKEALAELRRQLGVLRAAEEERPAPLPGLADVPALVAAGGAELEVAGRPAADMAPGLGLTVYRIVQESLTNARRHAPSAPARVRLRYDEQEIVVLVENDGASSKASDGAGNGLLGMRERVAMYGGRFEAGPRPGGTGWRVQAMLPLAPEPEPVS